MSKSQRTKGAAYERELARAFSDALGEEYKRNIAQARDGGNDLDVGPLVVEAKRRKTLTTIRQWLNQAKAAVFRKGRAGYVPVVVCREDNGESLVIIRLADFLSLAKDEILRRSRPEQLEMFVGVLP